MGLDHRGTQETVVTEQAACSRTHTPGLAFGFRRTRSCVLLRPTYLAQHSYSSYEAIAASAKGTADRSSGRKTEKHVPLRPGRVLLWKRIEPWCFCTIPLLTQRPNPVPRSPFVVTNGSKIRLRFSREIPIPLSAITTRTPDRPDLPHSLEAKACSVIAPCTFDFRRINFSIGY